MHQNYITRTHTYACHTHTHTFFHYTIPYLDSEESERIDIVRASPLPARWIRTHLCVRKRERERERERDAAAPTLPRRLFERGGGVIKINTRAVSLPSCPFLSFSPSYSLLTHTRDGEGKRDQEC